MWFPTPSLIESTDAATCSRGLQVFRAQQVLALDVLPGDSGEPDHWQLRGRVQGTQRKPYEVVVELFLTPDQCDVSHWISQCTCPVGEQCKHAVAVLIKAAYRGAPNESAESLALKHQQQALRAQAQQQAMLALQRRQQAAVAERWLLGSESGHPGAPHRQPGERTQPPKWPVYLLHLTPVAGQRQALHLALGAASPKAKGEGWNKPRRVSTQYFGLQQADQVGLTPDDRDILALLGALPPTYSAFRYGGADEWTLDTVAATLVLERAAATGRLFWRGERDTVGAAMGWGPSMDLQWRWAEEPGLTPEDALWRLQPVLPQPQAELCGNQPLLYVDLSAWQCGPVQGGDPAQLRELLQAPALPLHVMQAHQPALLRRLGSAVPLPPVLPTLQQVGGVPVWRLFIAPLNSTGLVDDAPPQALSAQLDFDYQGCQGWWPDAQTPALVERDNGERVLVQRDLGSETLALERLRGLGLMDWTEGLYVLPPHADQSLWLHWADQQFAALAEAGFQISTDATLKDWVRAGGELSVDLAPTADADGDTSPWFDLSLGLEVNGQRINLLPWLPQIIGQLRQAEGAEQAQWPEHLYLPGAGGQGFLRVSTAPLKPWLDGLLELFDDRAQDFDGDALRLSRIDALRARVALGEGVAWQGAQALDRLAQGLQGQSALPTTPPPKGLQAQLRPYQQHGLDWLQFLREHALAGILADDMGLGKTLQTLAHIQCEKEAGRLDRPALVIAPVSLLGNWQREAARFCPGLRCLVWHGAERHEQAEDLAQADFVIAPYSLLHRDRERWLAQAWHLVVLDEAQNIKNAATQASQVVGELNTRHRLCLSGTPIENHLGEIWSLFHFLMPGFLGSQQRFAQRFRTPIEKQGDAQRMAQLRARLTPFILRRTKDVVAAELPPKVETVMAVELGGKQADLYETIRLSMEKAVRDAIADKGLAKSQIAILDALLKLRQVCCDPRLVKTTAAAKVKQSAKLEQLMDMLPEMLAEGRRILLFSGFTSMLSLIEDELKKRKIAWVKLTGQTQKRDEVIERFTSGQVPLFLISLKAGGVGLNLPQADTVIHYDPWWNPAAENQATDRAHRIGQTQSVWVVKLVAQGTIEERILALQERKAQLARELYSGAAARKQPLFTQDDVQALLRPLG